MPIWRGIRSSVPLPEAIAMLRSGRMRKTELTHLLARKTRVSRAEAADQLDQVIHKILMNLRKGERAKLPGLGEFLPANDGTIRFSPSNRSKQDAD